jgi:hypothetical protein
MDIRFVTWKVRGLREEEKGMGWEGVDWIHLALAQ